MRKLGIIATDCVRRMTGIKDVLGDRAEWGKARLSRLSEDETTSADSAGVSSGDFGLRRVRSLPLSVELYEGRTGGFTNFHKTNRVCKLLRIAAGEINSVVHKARQTHLSPKLFRKRLVIT